jgi:isopentenyl diphosphate isomerase/L-lactate dehydrogenase-like FMN-dependent dehydrogenase
VRRTTDFVKALALGADAAMIGRPYLYGLAVGGEAGVRYVLERFRSELVRTLMLTGRHSIAEIDRSILDLSRFVATDPD